MKKLKGKVLVTLAIPNFNQGDQLDQGSEELRKLSELFSEEMEVVLRDNCSTDNSAEVLATRYSFARVYFNSANLGMVGSVEALTRDASGEWMWILGSGDLPKGDLKGLWAFLTNCTADIGLVISGELKSFSPFISGQIFRTEALRSISSSGPLRLSSPFKVWPHLDWCVRLKEMGWRVEQASLEVHASRGLGDWHTTEAMFPIARELRLQLLTYHKSEDISFDIRRAQDTMVSWYLMDRLSGKTPPLSLNLIDLISEVNLRLLVPKTGVKLLLSFVPRHLVSRTAKVSRSFGLLIGKFFTRVLSREK